MKISLPAFVNVYHIAKFQGILLLCIIICTEVAEAQITWFVKASPGGNNTGLDWENAFLNPQEAFDKAGDGDQIYIQSGIYLPIRNLNGQSLPNFQRDHTFFVNKNIKVYGSFDGHEISHWDRNFTEPKTVFSGDINEDDIEVADLQSEFFPLQNNQDNIYQILTIDSGVSSILLDGIHIYGGNANATIAGSGAAIFFKHNAVSEISVDIHNCMLTKNYSVDFGAAIFINAIIKELNISHTVFNSNRAEKDGAGIFLRSHRSTNLNISESSFIDHLSNQGGAIFFEVLNMSDLKVSGTDFINNKALESGGAIRFITTRNLSTFEIDHSKFLNNIAGSHGGAIYSDQSGINMDRIIAENNQANDGGFLFSTALEEYDISIINTELKNNTAANTGAGISAYNASLEVKESNFRGHRRPLVGGVFYLFHTVPKTRLYSILVDKCSFEKNEAVKGAVIFEAAVNQNSGKDNVLFLRSQFRDNTAEEGGVFYISQNIPINKVLSRTYFDCIFSDNKAINGGLQYYISTAAVDDYFLNCTFYNNKASGKDPLFFFEIPDAIMGRSVLDIVNCILWRNSGANQNAFIESNQNCAVNLYHSLIDRQNCDDLQYPVQCNNNIYNQDPLFFNTLVGDLRLRICSPAIDKGDNAPVQFPIFPETDIIKKSRIINDIVDLGAYEVPQPYFAIDTVYICPGDSLWNEAIGWIGEPGLYLDTMGVLNGCVDEHAYFALIADTIDYDIQTFASDCSYDGIEISVSSTSDVVFQWRKTEEILSSTESIKIQSKGWYFLTGTGANFCPLMDSIYIDSIPRMPVFTTDVSHINCLEPIAEIVLNSSDKNFRISWEGPDGITGNAALLQTSRPGIYTAIVRDALDCPYDFRIEILADTLSPPAHINAEEFDPCEAVPRRLIAETSNDANVSYFWESDSGIWESGADPLSILAKTSGLFYFSAVNSLNGCSFRDSIEVRMGAGEVFPLLWEEIHSGCGEQYTLAIRVTEIDGGVLPYQVLVDGLSREVNEFALIQAGAHQFRIIDWAGCEWDSTIIVHPAPDLLIDLGPDKTVKQGTNIELNAITEIAATQLQFTWNNNAACTGCSSIPLQIFNDTMIIVSALLNQDCIAYDTILIYILEDPRIFIPTAFSPNGDGINDGLEFFSGDNVKQVNSFKIFNRWGNLVFDSAHCTDVAGCKWDGKYKTIALDPQLLVWSMELEMKNGTTHQLQGEVAIIK
jgi:gliding motility-associated-like protein